MRIPEGRIPFVCGGYNGFDHTDVCYKYVAASDEWVESGNMAKPRAFSGYASSKSWGLVMSGGRGISNIYLSSIEQTRNGETFGNLPDLVSENYDSCVVVIDEDRIFTCGGRYLSTNTFIYSNTTNLWSR